MNFRAKIGKLTILGAKVVIFVLTKKSDSRFRTLLFQGLWNAFCLEFDLNLDFAIFLAPLDASSQLHFTFFPEESRYARYIHTCQFILRKSVNWPSLFFASAFQNEWCEFLPVIELTKEAKWSKTHFFKTHTLSLKSYYCPKIQFWWNSKSLKKTQKYHFDFEK